MQHITTLSNTELRATWDGPRMRIDGMTTKILLGEEYGETMLIESAYENKCSAKQIANWSPDLDLFDLRLFVDLQGKMYSGETARW